MALRVAEVDLETRIDLQTSCRAISSLIHWGVARYFNPPLRVAALRRSSREIGEADRPRRRPISRIGMALHLEKSNLFVLQQ